MSRLKTAGFKPLQGYGPFRELRLLPLSRLKLIGQDLRTRNLVVFKGNGFMALDYLFKTPRLHISTPLQIVTPRWPGTQRESAWLLRGL